MKTYIINTASGTLVDTLDGASTLSGLAPDLVAIQRADDQPCDINTLVGLALKDRAKAELDRTEHWGSRALEEMQLTGALTTRGRANLEYRSALREIVAGTRATWPGEPANA